MQIIHGIEERDYEGYEDTIESCSSSIQSVEQKTKGSNYGIIITLDDRRTFYVKTHSGSNDLEKGKLDYREFFYL